MDKHWSIVIIASYFAVLLLISYFTSRKASKKSFYTGDRASLWYLVAFGMIGASLSGITFISVPGTVLNDGSSYMANVIGFFIGGVVNLLVLLPVYYKLNLTTIYSYLTQRFGNRAYKTGASFFLISRIIGASLRLYLVAEVLDIYLFEPFDIAYWQGVILVVILIWIYTFRGGIKTIVVTDTLQTLSMLTAVVMAIYFIKEGLGWSLKDTFVNVYESEYSNVIFWEDQGLKTFFLNVLNGIFITIVMTGMDQDMMQKNLTCKNIREAQKNMFSMSLVIIPVHILFLGLGVLLFTYVQEKGLFEIKETAEGIKYFLTSPDRLSQSEIHLDKLFPMLAAEGYFSPALGVVFLIGLIAAAYSSADSALTSLTTSFCIDILEDGDNQRKRIAVHLGMSAVLILVILVFKFMNNDNVVWQLFKMTGFTYGPLLGMFSFGLISKRKTLDRWIPLVAVLAPILCYILDSNSIEWFGYKIGFEILLINGFLTYLGLLLLSKK